jgi:ribosomal protein L19E
VRLQKVLSDVVEKEFQHAKQWSEKRNSTNKRRGQLYATTQSEKTWDAQCELIQEYFNDVDAVAEIKQRTFREFKQQAERSVKHDLEKQKIDAQFAREQNQSSKHVSKFKTTLTAKQLSMFTRIILIIISCIR